MTVDEARKLVDKRTSVVNYTNIVSQADAYKIVTEIVNQMQAENDKLSVENVKLSAKIFAYEAILQNSNFKMAVVRKKKKKEEE